MIVVLILSIVLILAGSVLFILTNHERFRLDNLILGCVWLFAGLLFMIAFFYISGYKTGQINALSSTGIDYHLVEHPDGTKKWEKIIKE